MAKVAGLKPREVQELAERGQAIYDKQLREKLEPDHAGRFVAIEPQSGQYFLGDTTDEALSKAEQAHPNKLFHLIRIGQKGVHAVR